MKRKTPPAPSPNSTDDAPKSRSQKKREDEARKRFVDTLLAASPKLAKRLGLDEEILAELEHTRSVKAHIARKRARDHVAGMLRDDDLDDLLARWQQIHRSS